MKISKKKIVSNSIMNVEQLKKNLTEFLENEKLFEIVTISLEGKSQEADYMIIASGSSARQVVAVSEKLIQRLKSIYGILSSVEGLDSANWVLIDAGDIIVHIFRPEVRDYYQLERMWQVSNRIPVD